MGEKEAEGLGKREVRARVFVVGLLFWGDVAAGAGVRVSRGRSGQAYKGARGMPRHGQATKGAVSCEKHRGAARRLRSGDARMGKPGDRHGSSSVGEYIAQRRPTERTETSK